MKYDINGNPVADDDPAGVSDTPPTPPTPPVDPNNDVMSAYRDQLLAESRRNAQLQRELEEARRVPKAPPAPITPEREKEFFDKPFSNTRDIVREELASTVGPLNDYVQQQQRASLYIGLKSQMRGMPQRFAYLTQVESLMDQIMQGQSVINDNVVVAAYNNALGYFISNGGKLQDQTIPTPPTPTPTPVPPTPPHIRPSPTLHNNNNPNPRKTRPLNENEKKIARFNGFTDEQYLAWTNELTPSEVAHVTDEQITSRVK